MAWTTPRTWVAGELLTAALLNTHLRDNIADVYATAALSDRKLVVDTTSRQNVGTAATDWMSYAMPAGLLATNGMGLNFVAHGEKTGAYGHVNLVKLVIGTTTTTLLTLDNNPGPWSLDIKVYRTGAATGIGYTTGGVLLTLAETWANALTLKLTGQSDTGSNEVKQMSGRITLLVG